MATLDKHVEGLKDLDAFTLTMSWATSLLVPSQKGLNENGISTQRI